MIIEKGPRIHDNLLSTTDKSTEHVLETGYNLHAFTIINVNTEYSGCIILDGTNWREKGARWGTPDTVARY